MGTKVSGLEPAQQDYMEQEAGAKEQKEIALHHP
jgi:hypothetical protein